VRDDRRLNALARGRLRAQRGAAPRLAGPDPPRSGLPRAVAPEPRATAAVATTEREDPSYENTGLWRFLRAC
jgi:hypothetical protein